MMTTNGGGLLYVDLLLLLVAVIGVFISLFSKWNILGSLITVISFVTYSFLHPYWNFFVIILFVFGFLFLGFEVLIPGIGALGVLGTVFVLGGIYWTNQAGFSRFNFNVTIVGDSLVSFIGEKGKSIFS